MYLLFYGCKLYCRPVRWQVQLAECLFSFIVLLYTSQVQVFDGILLFYACHFSAMTFTLHGSVLNCSIKFEAVIELILMTFYILLCLYQCVASFFNLLFATFTEVTVMLFHAS